MLVELRGIIQYYDTGKKHVELVVKLGSAVAPVKVEMGVDVKVNHGRVTTFLSDLYGIPPGKIVWPEHITVKEVAD